MSQLTPVSIGIVAANKPLDSMEIEVTLTEQFPMMDGEITDNAETKINSSQDADGKAYQTSTTTSLSVKAKWLPIGDSQRLTAPDVRRGEKVDVYQFADTDKYYWTTRGIGSKLRKLETVIWGFSGTKDESANVDDDNFYYIEVSTHKKHIHIHTTVANGEPFGYDIQLNTDQGFLQIQDDIGNFINMNSQTHEFTLQNMDGSFANIKAENVHVHAVQDMKFTAGGNISFEAGSNFDSKAGGSTSIVSGSSNTVTGSSNTINGPTTINGTATVSGAAAMMAGLSVTGMSNMGGGGKFTGTLTGNGNIITTGNIVATGTVSGTNIN